MFTQGAKTGWLWIRLMLTSKLLFQTKNSN